VAGKGLGRKINQSINEPATRAYRRNISQQSFNKKRGVGAAVWHLPKNPIDRSLERG
jgi:hypothetical protein